ncbi:MAG: hypothetical protein WD845_09050 [Pirellulales bacterium]
MAGSLALTSVLPALEKGSRKYSFAWLSDAAGDVSGNYTNGVGSVTAAPDVWGFPGAIIGTLHRVAFIPDGGGTQPTTLYDVTLLDENAIDVLGGQGANLSNSVASHVCPGVPLKDGTTTGTTPIKLRDVLQLVVANAGNAKGGTVVLYVD